MRLEICANLSRIDRADWDALVVDQSPFLEWGWLASIEVAGCVTPETGWVPQHLILWEGKRLMGACPLYVKGHSRGEFVFDHAWAEAAARSGIRYYPKLLAGIPFTPVAGRRLLTHPEADRPALLRTLASALVEICQRNHFSSVHVNFCEADERNALAAAGFHMRTGYQFQWHQHAGWRSFDDYLSAFRSKRRVQIRRERRELDAQRVTIHPLHGDEIPDELFGSMFELYRTTIQKHYWGQQYLNRDLFEELRRHWKNRLVFFAAMHGGEVVAGTFTVRKGDTLYGRYWGAFQELRHLHFNVCYYASIEYCLQHGLTRFEPGAGGEFKYLRGFDPHPTYSMHYFTDRRFDAAVADFLKREETAVIHEIDWLEGHSPVKRPTTT